MLNDRKIVHAIRNELDIANLLGEGLTPDEIKKRIIQDLSPYFESRDTLKTIVLEYDLLAFEYGFYLTMLPTAWFKPALESIVDQLRRAKCINSDDCLQILAEWTPVLNGALQNAMDIFHLENDKSQEHLNLLAKICFREIGDIVEGSLQPFMRLLLIMHYISTGKHKPSRLVEGKTLGNVTNELLQTDQYSSLYQPPPWSIRINQWRNIANHNDYQADLDTNSIVCQYGTPGKRKTVRLKRPELVVLEKRCHDIAYTHKLAFTFFAVDNLADILKFSPTLEVSKDTAEAYLFEALYANGFEVAALTTEETAMTIELVDLDDRDEQSRLESLSLAVSIHKGLLNDRTLTFRIEALHSEDIFVVRVK